MGKTAEEHGFLKKTKCALIGSHIGVESLVNTDMAKCYFKKG